MTESWSIFLERNLYRLAAMYASLDDFKVGQPAAYVEADKGGYVTMLRAAFNKGYIADYRDGGRFHVDPRTLGKKVYGPPPTKKDRREMRGDEKAKADRSVIRRKDILNRMVHYRDLAAFKAAEPSMVEAAERLRYIDGVKSFYTRELPELEVYEEALMFRDFETFARDRPRHLQAAQDGGYLDHLRDGPGKYAPRISLRIADLKGDTP